MVMTHVAECEACRRLAQLNAGVQARMTLLRERVEDADLHPDFEALAAYVDGRLDAVGRASVDQHVAECDLCAEDLQDLAATRRETSTGARIEPPAPQAANTLIWSDRTVRYALAAGLLVAMAGIAWYGQRIGPSPQQTGAGLHKGTPPAERFALVDPIGRVAVVADGTVTGLNRLAPADATSVAGALTSGQLPVPQTIASLATPAGPLMGGGSSTSSPFLLTSPAGTLVLSATPEFAWTAAPGARTYTVSVFDDQLNKVTESGALTATRWTTRTQLERGHVYSWQVRAVTSKGSLLAPGPSSGQARFRVLDAAAASAIEEARTQYGSTPLVMGVLYTRAGLLDDAVRELEALVRANPDSTVAADLLRQVRAARK